MIKLTQIAKDFIEKHGTDAAAKTAGVSAQEAASWADGKKQPSLVQIEKLLTADPDPINAIKPLSTTEDLSGRRLAILTQSNRGYDVRVVQALARLYDSAKMRWFTNWTSDLVRGRNFLAQRFLESDCEYCLWVDDDVILQCGDAKFFKSACNCPNYPEAFASVNTIGALVSSGKKLIGGIYFDRRPGGIAQFANAYADHEVNASAHTGPRDTTEPTAWAANGCLLVHRDVFVDIVKKKQVDAIDDEVAAQYQYKFGFFDKIGALGEDQSFCRRAAAAGHQPYVHYAVMPGHVGPAVFTAYNTKS